MQIISAMRLCKAKAEKSSKQANLISISPWTGNQKRMLSSSPLTSAADLLLRKIGIFVTTFAFPPAFCFTPSSLCKMVGTLLPLLIWRHFFLIDPGNLSLWTATVDIGTTIPKSKPRNHQRQSEEF